MNEGDKWNAKLSGCASGRQTADAGRMIGLSPSSNFIAFIPLKKYGRVQTGSHIVPAEFNQPNGSDRAGVKPDRNNTLKKQQEPDTQEPERRCNIFAASSGVWRSLGISTHFG